MFFFFKIKIIFFGLILRWRWGMKIIIKASIFALFNLLSWDIPPNFRKKIFSATISLLKVTREWNTKAMCEICSNITITDTRTTSTTKFWCLCYFGRFHTFLCCFHCWFWASKCQLGLVCKKKNVTGRQSFFHPTL